MALYARTFQTFGDANGVFYFLGTRYDTQAWANPAASGGLLVATASTIFSGRGPYLLTDRGAVTTAAHTNSAANQWFQLTLPEGTSLRPTYYTIRGRDDFTSTFPRYWVLEASNDGTTWVTLRTHVNDTSVTGKGVWAGWTLDTGGQPYRHFRLRQTVTDYWVLGEVEFYGDFDRALPGDLRARLIPSAVATVQAVRTTTARADLRAKSILELLPPHRKLLYSAAGDTNGLIHWLGTKEGTTAFQNPQANGQLTATASGENHYTQVRGNATDRAASTDFVSGNTQGSWIAFDVGRGRSIRVSRYTMQGRSGSTEQPRSWKLQGSNDAQSWADLDTRTNDTTVAPGVWGSWPIEDGRSWRYLRVLITGPNSSNRYYLSFAEIDFYGLFFPMQPIDAQARVRGGASVSAEADVRGVVLTDAQITATASVDVDAQLTPIHGVAATITARSAMITTPTVGVIATAAAAYVTASASTVAAAEARAPTFTSAELSAHAAVAARTPQEILAEPLDLQAAASATIDAVAVTPQYADAALDAAADLDSDPRVNQSHAAAATLPATAAVAGDPEQLNSATAHLTASAGTDATVGHLDHRAQAQLVATSRTQGAGMAPEQVQAQASLTATAISTAVVTHLDRHQLTATLRARARVNDATARRTQYAAATTTATATATTTLDRLVYGRATATVTAAGTVDVPPVRTASSWLFGDGHLDADALVNRPPRGPQPIEIVTHVDNPLTQTQRVSARSVEHQVLDHVAPRVEVEDGTAVAIDEVVVI